MRFLRKGCHHLGLEFVHTINHTYLLVVSQVMLLLAPSGFCNLQLLQGTTSHICMDDVIIKQEASNQIMYMEIAIHVYHVR